MTIPKRSEELQWEQLEAREAGAVSDILTFVPHAAELAAHGVGSAANWVGDQLHKVVRDTQLPDVVQGWDHGINEPVVGPPGVKSLAELIDLGLTSAAGYGLYRSRKGIGNAARSVADAVRNAPILHKETRGDVPAVKMVKNQLGLDAQHGPRGPRGASVELETGIMHELEEIEEMLECICGQKCRGNFNGMPHCLPGEGCCSNAIQGSDACGSCGNPAAAGCFHGMPICAPGAPGCNQEWNPDSESAAEKIADHDNWAVQTNHGQYAMPGEGPKPQRPGTTWE